MDFIHRLDGITEEAGQIAVTFFNEQGEIELTPAAIHVDGTLGVSKTSFRRRLPLPAEHGLGAGRDLGNRFLTRKGLDGGLSSRW